MKQKKLLFFVSEDWYFCSHRIALAIEAKNAGYNVAVVTRVRSHGKEIENSGIKLIPIELSRSGINPFRDMLVIFRLVRIYKSEQPDIVHHVAMKPVLYGLIAALIAGIPSVVSAIAGMGFLFISNSMKVRFLRVLVLTLLGLLFKQQGRYVILQNSDDIRLMCYSGALSRDQITLIRGSGVDINKFDVSREPDGELIVVLASRMLWDKGVGEFVEAARRLKGQGVSARFVLVGDGDDENPANINDKQLKAWAEEGAVELWGRREDMPKVFADSHIVCLPSYREGLPKVLIEAAACGRPIVTTDVPGCREIVKDGVNGILVPFKDSPAIAVALKKLIDSPKLRHKMGDAGRVIAKTDFSQEKVNVQTLKLYESLIN